MNGWAIAGIIVGSFIVVLLLFDYIKYLTRKSTIKTWKVGDVILFDETNAEGRAMQQKAESKGLLAGELVGATTENIVVRLSDTIQAMSWKAYRSNKSAYWRELKSTSTKLMGDADFTDQVSMPKTEVKEQTESHGQPFETMNETELHAHLKIALKDEDYETASKIREQLKRFR